MTVDEGEHWALEELPGNLAALTCTHVLDRDATPAFVDYNGGHLTIFCERGEDHPDKVEYRMMVPSHFLERYQSLGGVRLLGGHSRAELDNSGRWRMSLQPQWDEETKQ